jgi:hypothetical protein
MFTSSSYGYFQAHSVPQTSYEACLREVKSTYQGFKDVPIEQTEAIEWAWTLPNTYQKVIESCVNRRALEDTLDRVLNDLTFASRTGLPRAPRPSDVSDVSNALKSWIDDGLQLQDPRISEITTEIRETIFNAAIDLEKAKAVLYQLAQEEWARIMKIPLQARMHATSDTSLRHIESVLASVDGVAQLCCHNLLTVEGPYKCPLCG